MKRITLSFIIILFCSMLASFVYLYYHQEHKDTTSFAPIPSLEIIQSRYQNKNPTQWGENIPGVTTKISPIADKPMVYLTFDLCMGDYDKAMVTYLIQHKIHATFFINSRWIDSHLNDFKSLAQNPLFAIQNHGTLHRPLSVNGREIYHIKGTDSIQGVYEEIMGNDRKIFELTGKKPRYFRSGTAYYDDIAVQIAKDLGYEIGGFDVLGDAGATYSKNAIIAQAKKVRDGSILIYHANKPKSDTFAGMQVVIPMLEQEGFNFGVLE